MCDDALASNGLRLPLPLQAMQRNPEAKAPLKKPNRVICVLLEFTLPCSLLSLYHFFILQAK